MGKSGKTGGNKAHQTSKATKQAMSTTSPANEQPQDVTTDTTTTGAQDKSQALLDTSNPVQEQQAGLMQDGTTSEGKSFPEQGITAIAPAAKEVLIPQVQVVEPTDNDIVTAALRKVGVNGKTVLFTLQSYMQDMKPGKPLDPTVGATHQANLFRALQQAINTVPDQDFDVVFPVILELFNREAKGVFQEEYVFRFLDVVKLSSDERASFQKVLNMLKLMADPRGRQIAKKQLNFSKGFGPSISEDGRQRVLNYFNI